MDVCGFKYLASEKSREPVGGDAAQALATCPDSAVAIKIGTTEMDNAIAIDNNTLRMGEATRTPTGDHESRVTDTGTSIVQSAGCLNPGDPMTLRIYAEGGANPTLQNGGTGGTIRQGVVQSVVAIDGNKLCKNERAGGSGIGFNTDGVAYTETACDNKHHAVAVRTANTHANVHGVADEATHTLDRASGQAVAIGFKPGQSGREDTGSLGAQSEQSPTLPREPGGLGVGVAVERVEPEVCKTLSAEGFDGMPDIQKGNGQPVVAQRVRLHHVVRRLTPVECERLQGFPDGWTRIPYRGKPADECPDSPRYKALGNSWATNCAEYILRRIVAAFMLDLVPEAAE